MIDLREMLEQPPRARATASDLASCCRDQA